ncbi:MAG: hypothetical protein ABI193_14215, partial [Minicystis sp.]
MNLRVSCWIGGLSLFALAACGGEESTGGNGGAGTTGTGSSTAASTTGSGGDGGSGGEAPVLGTHFDEASADWTL